jgi:hypothetical protein
MFNAIGGVSGLLSIVLLVWRGGALVQQVNDHDRRIVAVEQFGSSALGTHVKYDDERVQTLKERTLRLENILVALPDLQREVAVVNVKMDGLQKTLDEYIKRILAEKQLK